MASERAKFCILAMHTHAPPTNVTEAGCWGPEAAVFVSISVLHQARLSLIVSTFTLVFSCTDLLVLLPAMAITSIALFLFLASYCR